LKKSHLKLGGMKGGGVQHNARKKSRKKNTLGGKGETGRKDAAKKKKVLCVCCGSIEQF